MTITRRLRREPETERDGLWTLSGLVTTSVTHRGEDACTKGAFRPYPSGRTDLSVYKCTVSLCVVDVRDW